MEREPILRLFVVVMIMITALIAASGASASSSPYWSKTLSYYDCPSQEVRIRYHAKGFPAGTPFKVWVKGHVENEAGERRTFESYEDGFWRKHPDRAMVYVDVPVKAFHGKFRVWANLKIHSLAQDPESPMLTENIDFAIRCKTQPKTVTLGDRVWRDLNGDGIQNCRDGGNNNPALPADGIIGNAGDRGLECNEGVPNVDVELFAGANCQSATGRTTRTDANGFYAFEGLNPGQYCVKFDKATLPTCDAQINGRTVFLGNGMFTMQNKGEETRNSDADPLTGMTAAKNVPNGRNLSFDAGVVCPAKLGDKVFVDENGDGLQQITETGVAGVEVQLFDCGRDGVAGTNDDRFTGETRTTDSQGMYMFGGESQFQLDSGRYYVMFEPSTFPLNYTTTLPNRGNNDARDSDCLPSGQASCTDLRGFGKVDLTQDCGLQPPAQPRCDLSIDLTCDVPRPVNNNYECDKPIDSLTMIWSGNQNITVNAWKGEVGSQLLANRAPVNAGGELSVSGYAGSPNDVTWEIFAANGNKLGESVFHLSCSDKEMDGPEDCGAPQGNGKKNASGLINDWLLEGIVDQSGALNCTSDTPDFPTMQSCSVTPSNTGCEQGKPTELVFAYEPGNCAASTNDQDGKFECSGSLSGNLSSATVTGKKGKKGELTVSQSGTQVTLTTSNGDKLPSESILTLTDSSGQTQNLNIHTSCSKALNVGDRFGSLRLISFNGQTGGQTVNLGYTVTNNGAPISNLVINNSLQGDVIGPVAIDQGETLRFTSTADVLTAGSITAIAGDSSCNAMDTLDVDVLVPPKSCDDGKPTELRFNFTGQSCSATTNTQGGRFECEGSALSNLASVVVDSSNKKAKDIMVIQSGNQVIVQNRDSGKKLPSETVLILQDSAGRTQTVNVHTSCSRAINVGDVFGALTLEVFVPEN